MALNNCRRVTAGHKPAINERVQLSAQVSIAGALRQQVHALHCSGEEGRQVCTFICDVELPSQHIGVLVLGIGPRKFAGIAVPKGPGFGLAGHKLVKVEGRELLQITMRCKVAITAPPGIPVFALLSR